MTFDYYAELYLKFGKQNWRNSTYEKNSGIVKNRLSDFSNMKINEIKPSIIKLWLNSIDDVSNKSKKHYISALSQIFQLALQDEVISKNPLIHLANLHHDTPKIQPFNDDEVQAILQASKHFTKNFQIFLYLGFFTGMRTGEILALKIKDIDLDNLIININATRSRFGENEPKTLKSKRQVPILKSFENILRDFINNDKDRIYLLQTQYNRPYKDCCVFQTFWAQILADLRIKYRRPYTMRHTYATFMLANNYASPVRLASLMGHSTPKMIYTVYVNYLNQNLKDFNRDLVLYKN